MKLPCSVVRDLLPLYAEKLTEDETNQLIHEHLEGCPECRQRLSEIDTGTPSPVESAKPLLSLKKEICRRRLFSALCAALTVFVAVFTFFCHESKMVLVPWQSGLIEVEGIEKRPYSELYGNTKSPELSESTVDVLVLRVGGIINGTKESAFTEEDGTRTVILQGWSSQHTLSSLMTEDHEMILSPAPDRLIYSAGGQHNLLWGEAMNGGVEELPRLALAYYFLAASGFALVLGAVWFFLRKRHASWIPRQLFFAPVSYLTAHLLIMGTKTETFFMERDFISIVLTAAALYALLSLGWQIGLQHVRKTV